MATEKSDKPKKATGATGGTTTQAPGQMKIVWDDSDMRSVYANVSNVAGGREEIVLLFGMNQSWHAGQKEVKVQLTDRVVLSPFAAKRLSILLNNVINDYEMPQFCHGQYDLSISLRNFECEGAILKLLHDGAVFIFDCLPAKPEWCDSTFPIV